MSDTSVSITPGSGANVDTRTEATNGNHRQVVVLGDPSVNAGVAPVDGTAGLKVDLGTDNDVTVSGTVTVDLGVNNDVTVTSGAITETNSAAIKTAVETIDNAISGSEMQVDVITMPTTTVQATDLDIRNLTNTDVVTAELSATDNAVLDSIAASLAGTLTVTGGGGGVEYTEGDTDATIVGSAIMWEDTSDTLRSVSAAKPLPVNIISGAGSGGTAAADDADFTATVTSGTPAMGVYESTPTNVTDGDLGVVGITTGRRMKTSATIDAALPAGTNNIGDVDVASSALPTGASTSANQSTIIGHLDGVEGLLTTIDADTGNVSTKIDTIAGAVAGTEMQVDVLTMPTVTVTATNLDVQSGGADLATSTQAGAIQTAVQLLDDTVQVLGTDTYTEASSKGITLGAVRRDADTTLANTTNEFAPLQVDANGRLKVEAFSGETLPVSMTSTTVTGTVAVTQSGTWDEVGINDSGNSITVDAPVGTPAFVRLSDGAAAITTLPVSLASVPSHAVTNAGTFATQVDGSALTALQLIDDTIFADDAGVTLGTSKGSVLAGVAVNTDGTDPTAVSAEGDAAALRTDMNRLLIVNQTHPRFWHVSADYASAQTNVSVKAAPGASLSLYITDLTISNGATAGNITLLDGSGGTVLYEIYPGVTGGVDKQLRSPIKLTANTALCLTSTSVTTHSIFVSGYIAA